MLRIRGFHLGVVGCGIVGCLAILISTVMAGQEISQTTARETFQAEFNGGCLGGPGCGNVAVPIAVPNGKVLIIEHVSVLATVPPAQTVGVRVGVGNPLHHLVLTPQLSYATEQWFTASQPIRIYVAQGEDFRIVSNASGAGGSLLVTVSGRFVGSVQ